MDWYQGTGLYARHIHRTNHSVDFIVNAYESRVAIYIYLLPRQGTAKLRSLAITEVTLTLSTCMLKRCICGAIYGALRQWAGLGDHNSDHRCLCSRAGASDA